MSILKRLDLTGCASNVELAELLDKAFSQWQPDQPDGRGRRGTPRVDTGDVGPLFLVSYAFDGRDVPVNRRAPFLDISADGLGVQLGFPLPSGAALCFAFQDETGERNYGFALVAHSQRCDQGYRIGLTFAEKAGSLDVEHDADDADTTREAGRRWRHACDRLFCAVSTGFARLRGAAPVDEGEVDSGEVRRPGALRGRFAFGWRAAREAFRHPPEAPDESFAEPQKGFFNGVRRVVEGCGVAYATAVQSHAACRELGAELYNRRASVVVDAKLFRYQASLYVDGQKVVCRAGRLRDRFDNLFSPTGRPTMVHLEGGGFAAWAAVRPNAVTDAGIDVCMPIKQRMIEQLRGSQPVGPERSRAGNDDSAKPDSA